ncbi:glycosyl hydrolase 115 family protein [Amycolatopsis acidiphila]|uniref:Glycosyl hydrolase n=1 Tax=Amycolatopsis acidiphila TaxID=715473 RepID=A0A558A533_9PSEU|nr:glycosyl hydrolase 115 family protein [Amycolatopsis acidiphila]TVT19356.1 glycosyl hydrolase [Amycolatopsis acidiphila]UIJ61721.1 glycosyl hydrolase 115 family protein [Amycolatopsis acidiphila]GHG58222.1 hypothetical protein GCM10017788_10680 [Amycolatopsis acidiphila]
MRRSAAILASLAFALTAVVAPVPSTAAPAAPADDFVVHDPGPGRFPLAAQGRTTPIVVSGGDYEGVAHAAADLQGDLQRVTGTRPVLSVDTVPSVREVVLIGTLGHSPLVDDLVRTGKLDVGGIAGKWETSLQQVVENPMPGVRRALVVAGSDQRGTIYGGYEISRQIGVSPWYWWDDVPAAHQNELYVLPGRHSQGTPAVEYRGFFLNDENPALGRWAPGYFGPGLAPGYPNGFNSQFYAKIFETMLRLKANYLWPAVWGRAFAEDDPQNHLTAKAYGVVMGTSHEAPMMRGIEEWNRHATPGSDPYGGNGQWSFRTNADAIKKYWTEGIKRMTEEDFEGVVTLGMRGNGDTSLPDGDGIDLMKDILASQRQILGQVTGKDVTTIPQVQTLYKEVQRYWDEGLRPPDDVTVVFADDNWGNLRKLPEQTLPPRGGGYGLYYHFDYVGGGRDYKWADTNLLPNIWDQLNQAYQYGVNRLWTVNVGDLKNDELPTQFFLDYAWNPARWPLAKLGEWERRYTAESFGPWQAGAIAEVLHTYAILQSRRKPELLNRRITTGPDNQVVYDDQASPFSLTDYQELDRVTAQWQQLAAQAEAIRRTLPAALQDAYYELVYYEVKASANLYALRQAEFTNLLYAKQGRAATNDLADVTDARFADDQAMSDYYNNTLAGGKWRGFQTQPKIGYGDVARYGPGAGWQEPELNNEALPDEVFPAVQRIALPDRAELGVAIGGSDKWWPAEPSPAVLPTFSPYQSQPQQYFDVFDRGSVPFDFQVRSGAPWVHVDQDRGRVDKQTRVTVWVDWAHAPKGRTTVPLTVTGNGTTVQVQAVVDNTLANPKGFVEANGYVSMQADHFTRAVGAGGVQWQRIPDIGRDGSGMEPFPVTAPRQVAGQGPRLEYTMTLSTAGPVQVLAYLSPRNDAVPGEGLKYAVSIDDEQPQVVDVIAATGADDAGMNRQWERNTSDNVNLTTTTHTIAAPGVHTVKVWMIDPTVVVQKLVVNTGGLRPSYLGPPESRRG